MSNMVVYITQPTHYTLKCNKNFHYIYDENIYDGICDGDNDKSLWLIFE